MGGSRQVRVMVRCAGQSIPGVLGLWGNIRCIVLRQNLDTPQQGAGTRPPRVTPLRSQQVSQDVLERGPGDPGRRPDGVDTDTQGSVEQTGDLVERRRHRAPVLISMTVFSTSRQAPSRSRSKVA